MPTFRRKPRVARFAIFLLCKKYVAQLKNPFRRTSEHNCKFCVRLFERTIKASDLQFAAKCRH